MLVVQSSRRRSPCSTRMAMAPSRPRSSGRSWGHWVKTRPKPNFRIWSTKLMLTVSRSHYCYVDVSCWLVGSMQVAGWAYVRLPGSLQGKVMNSCVAEMVVVFILAIWNLSQNDASRSSLVSTPWKQQHGSSKDQQCYEMNARLDELHLVDIRSASLPIW